MKTLAIILNHFLTINNPLREFKSRGPTKIYMDLFAKYIILMRLKTPEAHSWVPSYSTETLLVKVHFYYIQLYKYMSI